MNFKTFFGLLIALISAVACAVFIDIIKTRFEAELIICAICSGFGVIGGIAYAIEDTKLGEKMANLFADEEGE